MTMQLTFHRSHYTGYWVEDNAEYIKEVTGFYPPAVPVRCGFSSMIRR